MDINIRFGGSSAKAGRAVWAPPIFSNNRDRLIDGVILAAFFEAAVFQADAKQLLAHDHFTNGSWEIRHVNRRPIRTRG